MDIPQPIGEQLNNKEAIGESKVGSEGVTQTPVPFHTHNGTDSPKINKVDLNANIDGITVSGRATFIMPITSDRDYTFPDCDGKVVVAENDTGAPGYTPSDIGLIYCDTSGGKVYISTGTSSSSDWKILN